MDGTTGTEIDDWGERWASRLLLFFGATLILAGVTFFFAFNWAVLPDLAKLGIVEVGFVACVAGACIRRTTDIVRRVLLVAAGVLTGVFLAVFGQVYQTGADAWQLFALWSALLAPFVVLARLQGGWLLLSFIASLASVLFLNQELALTTIQQQHVLPNVVAATTGGIWIGLEVVRARRAPDWLRTMWSRTIFATLVFGAILLVVLINIINQPAGPLPWVQLAVFVMTTLLLVGWLAVIDFDVSALAVGGLAWLIAAVTWVGWQVFDIVSDGIPGVFIMLVFTLGSSTALVAGLRALARKHGGAR